MWCRNPLLSRINLMKIGGLVADVTSVGPPARAERETLGVIWDIFWPIEAAFVVGEPLCDLKIPSWALITLRRVL